MKCVENGKVNEYNINSKFTNIMGVILDVFERNEKEGDPFGESATTGRERYYDLNHIFDNPDEHVNFFKTLETDLSNELYNHKELVKETINKYSKKI